MSKRKCVLGVLTTEAGLKIKEEMLSWLNDYYEVFVVEDNGNYQTAKIKVKAIE